MNSFVRSFVCLFLYLCKVSKMFGLNKEDSWDEHSLPVPAPSPRTHTLLRFTNSLLISSTWRSAFLRTKPNRDRQVGRRKQTGTSKKCVSSAGQSVSRDKIVIMMKASAKEGTTNEQRVPVEGSKWGERCSFPFDIRCVQLLEITRQRRGSSYSTVRCIATKVHKSKEFLGSLSLQITSFVHALGRSILFSLSLSLSLSLPRLAWSTHLPDWVVAKSCEGSSG